MKTLLFVFVVSSQSKTYLLVEFLSAQTLDVLRGCYWAVHLVKMCVTNWFSQVVDLHRKRMTVTSKLWLGSFCFFPPQFRFYFVMLINNNMNSDNNYDNLRRALLPPCGRTFKVFDSEKWSWKIRHRRFHALVFQRRSCRPTLPTGGLLMVCVWPTWPSMTRWCRRWRFPSSREPRTLPAWSTTIPRPVINRRLN